MKKISNLCIKLVVLVFLVCCQNNESKTNKTLRLNFEVEPISLDPKLGTNVTSQIAIRALFEGLMKIGETGEVVLGIAESYSVSDDKKNYVFKLKDTYWSNKEKLSAYDFEKAWKNAIRPGSLCRIPQLFYPIKNAKKIRENILPIDEMGVRAIDDKTLQVELEHPVPFFLSLLSNPLFSPTKNIDVEDKINEIISNGPFILGDYQPNKGMYLVKNPHYHLSDQIKIDKIDISFIKDNQTAMYMFNKGEFDFIGDPVSKIPFEEEEKLLKADKLNIMPVAGMYWIGFNTEKTPYDNIHFRRALAYSLNNELFSQELNNKKPAKTFVPDFMSNLKEFSSWFDVNEAQKQLEIALSELNLSKDSLPVIKLTYCEKMDGGGKRLPLLIKSQWENNLKIKVDLQEVEWNSYLDAIFKHKLDVAGVPWFSYINDSLYLLETFKLRSYLSNWTLWENKEFAESLDKSNQCAELEERKKFLSNAEKVIEKEMPIVPLFYEDYRYLIKPNVQNIVFSKIGELEFRYCSIN